MAELEPLRADHAPAVLDFETANRAWFARTISDRGDDYFDRFAEHHADLLAEQDSGRRACYVLVADGDVLGRVNLLLLGGGVAELGYRFAEAAAGRGVATAAVRRISDLAADRYDVTALRAAVSDANVASRRVLEKAGFAEVDRADPSEIGGQQGSWYERDVSGAGRRRTPGLPTGPAR